MAKKDLIVAASKGYQWDQLKNWVYSCKQSGFKGHVYVILYDANQEIEAALKKHDIGVFRPTKDHLGRQGPLGPLVHRFYHKWILMNQIGIENINRVITSDIRDVVFQSDPTAWLDENLGDQKIFISSEGMAYQDEEWNRENFKVCFGEEIWSSGPKLQTIYNCGVWGGVSQYAAELFMLIYLIGFGHPAHTGEWTDQATLNLIARYELLKDKVKFLKSEDGFVAQLGTFLDSSMNYDEFLNEPKPVIRDGEVYTASDKKYVLVHQYDRIPELVDSFHSSLCGKDKPDD